MYLVLRLSVVTGLYSSFKSYLLSTLNEFTYYNEEEFCLPFMFACHMCFNVMCLIIFGKKLIRAYVCIMYVPNQNKVFVFVCTY